MARLNLHQLDMCRVNHQIMNPALASDIIKETDPQKVQEIWARIDKQFYDDLFVFPVNEKNKI